MHGLSTSLALKFKHNWLKRVVLTLGNTSIKAALWVDVSVRLLMYECVHKQEWVRSSRLTIVVSVLSRLVFQDSVLSARLPQVGSTRHQTHSVHYSSVLPPLILWMVYSDPIWNFLDHCCFECFFVFQLTYWDVHFFLLVCLLLNYVGFSYHFLQKRTWSLFFSSVKKKENTKIFFLTCT